MNVLRYSAVEMGGLPVGLHDIDPENIADLVATHLESTEVPVGYTDITPYCLDDTNKTQDMRYETYRQAAGSPVRIDIKRQAGPMLETPDMASGLRLVQSGRLVPLHSVGIDVARPVYAILATKRLQQSRKVVNVLFEAIVLNSATDLPLPTKPGQYHNTKNPA